MATATIIGSGPNGLAAGIVLAKAGVATTIVERNQQIGGACSTGEVTLPGFRHDLGSSAYPMGVASPFFRSLPNEIPWIEPQAACAHPLDDGTAVVLEHSIDATIAGLDGVDGRAYRSMIEPLVEQFDELIAEVLGPMLRAPRHPLLMARFGLQALVPAVALARRRFSGERARALFAGMAAHSVLPLEERGSAAVAMLLMAAGHARGWPILRGGGQTLTDALAKYFGSLGGKIETGREVTGLSEFSGSDVVLADVTPRQLIRIAGEKLPAGFRRKLEEFQYGAGSFKIDYALSEAIPWTAKDCRRATTVHVGGTMEEIAASERGFSSEAPFVLVVQPSLFDASRAPEGRHTAWAYCHVPNGSGLDRVEDMERQMERFAPGFRECVLARAVSPPAALERWNPNLIGGDVTGGAMTLKQTFFRPTAALYRTPVAGLFLCGASTPPGGGVHGMSGFYGAQAALSFLRR